MATTRTAEHAEMERTAGGGRLQLKVGGMSCSFCSESIRKAIGREKGVSEVHVSLAHEEALVRFDPEQTTETKIRDTLRSLGYTIRDPRKVQSFEEQEEVMRRERDNLIVSGSFAAAVALAMLFMWLGWLEMRDWHVWLSWAAATFVFFWSGRHFIRMAWGAARRGITNQHVLLTAGAMGGYIGGILGAPVPFLDWYGLVGFPALHFFGVVIFLTAYHILSSYVSLVVRTRASQSVRKLLELQPPVARVVRDGEEREVPIEEVKAGDLVRIRPGEKVPVDGEVTEGRGAVDEALVSGEPIPADKGVGDEVIGGSVNQTGTLLVRVTRVGEESFLRQVVRHVEEAKALKPGIIELVDRVLKRYVPAVLAIALSAFLFWGVAWGFLAGEALWVRGVYAALAVLVMGYPCALGMATPLALIRGGGMAAERGILMRSGEAFQVLKDIRYVVLDKTGTLTVGRPRVVEAVPLGGYDRNGLLQYAAAAESPSEHPLGRAIVESAEEEGVEVAAAEDFRAVAGAGVEATVSGRRVVIGSPGLISERGVDVGPADSIIEGQEAEARTVVLVAVDGEVAGVIAIADAIKPDAREAIGGMKALGLTPMILTGDAERTARAVAAELGIEEVRARVLPDRKAERVRELQRGGTRVAFVGDGINDAPALMQADVGIAIGAGTDIAIESSDVILIGERLSAVVEAYHIGGKSYRKTVQNLWLAFVFNGVGVPLAATGLVHPVWAMLAMAASVSAVLLNSFGARALPRARRTPPEVAAEAVESREVPPEEPAGREAPSEEAGKRVKAPEGAPPGALARAVLEVPDIHCAGCENNIEWLLGHQEGVEEVEADARTHRVRVAFHPGRIGLGGIEEGITSLGYRVRHARVTEGGHVTERADG